MWPCSVEMCGRLSFWNQRVLVLSRCLQLGGTVRVRGGEGRYSASKSLCQVRIIVPIFFGSAVFLYLMVFLLPLAVVFPWWGERLRLLGNGLIYLVATSGQSVVNLCLLPPQLCGLCNAHLACCLPKVFVHGRNTDLRCFIWGDLIRWLNA